MRRFTAAEDSWLRRHRGDGVTVLAEILGRDTAEIVQRAFELGIVVPLVPERSEVCPRCGRPMTRWGAGWKHGLCEVCWTKHKRDALRNANAEKRAFLEYNRERRKAQNIGD